MLLITLLPILFPIFAGILFPFLPENNRKARGFYLIAVLVVVNVLVLFHIFKAGELVVAFSISPSMPISFYVDSVSKLFSGLTCLVWLLAGLFSLVYFSKDKNQTLFYTFYLIVLGVLIGLDYAANLITFYMFYEFLTLTSLPLVLHARDKEAISAGLKYLFYSLFGAFLALLGIFFLYHYTDNLTFTPGGVLKNVPFGQQAFLFLPIALCMLIGFGTKAGMFPLHGWLPTAHPAAPAPASAVLSGIIAKSGVLAIIRLTYQIFGAETLAGTWVQAVWIVLILITIFMGSVLAFKEKILKKRLAYSTVSQISYILLGLAMFQPEALTGSLAHIIFHALAKSALFLCAGAIIFQTGKTYVAQLPGIGKAMPSTLLCFTLAALSLVGIPFTGGFLSKWHIATGALESGLWPFSWLGPAVLLISALLTAGYLFPIAIDGFCPGPAAKEETKLKTSFLMTFPLGIFALASIGFGIFSDGIFGVLQGIANALF